MSHTKTVPSDVRDILARSAIDGNVLKLPQQLDRETYVKVDKVLKAIGGKWNRKLAGHVFAGSPQQAIDAACDTGQVTDERKKFCRFNTPPEVAERVIEAADIGPGQDVLEPSAGTGALIDKAFMLNSSGFTGNPPDGRTVAVEINHTLADALRARYPKLDVRCSDFLTCNGDLGQFDRIVMNPPFEKGSDIKHIRHAQGFLKPGGRLVALCANGPRQQEILKPIAEESGGYYEPLPEGSFAESGTNVNVAMLVIERSL
jgi:protein-L-isoaspartate O-methyltransferase